MPSKGNGYVYSIHRVRVKDVKGQVRPVVTIAYGRKGERYGVGIAVCSPRDNPSNKEGRQIALHRLEKSFDPVMLSLCPGLTKSRFVVLDGASYVLSRCGARDDILDALEAAGMLKITGEGGGSRMECAFQFAACEGAVPLMPERVRRYLLPA